MRIDDPSRAPEPSTPPASADRSRPSLRELARRATESAPRSSPVAAPVSSTGDSGFVDLGAVHASATPEQRARAERAQPGEHDLFEEDRQTPPIVRRSALTDSAPPLTAAVIPPAPAAPVSNRQGMIVGVSIAAIGLAAAFAFWARNHAHQTRAPVVVELTTTQAPRPVAPAARAIEAAPAAAPLEQGTDVASLPDKEATPARAQGVAKDAPPSEKAVAPSAPAQAAAVAHGSPAKQGDLVSEMEKRTGKSEASKEAAPPETAPTTKSNGSLPEVPSQGSVSAAVASVRGAAKACVADGDDVTRAQVTFGPTGSVTAVVVTGWAAANGKSSCIKSAFQSANVGAFSKPSYTFSATIRP